MKETAYPLCWPQGHPRAHMIRDSRFGTNHWQQNKRISLADVISRLCRQMELLGVQDFVLSSNLKLRMDGLPYGNQAQPDDKGVALYFTYKKRRVALPCDKWKRIECNIMAIVSHLDALRGQQRWGVADLERDFAGYAALPEKGSSPAWYDVLGLPHTANTEEINARFRHLAKTLHPDVGGGGEEWHRVNEAKNIGLASQPR